MKELKNRNLPSSLPRRSRRRPGGNPSTAAGPPSSPYPLAAARGRERAKPARRWRRRGLLVSARGGFCEGRTPLAGCGAWRWPWQLSSAPTWAVGGACQRWDGQCGGGAGWRLVVAAARPDPPLAPRVAGDLDHGRPSLPWLVGGQRVDACAVARPSPCGRSMLHGAGDSPGGHPWMRRRALLPH